MVLLLTINKVTGSQVEHETKKSKFLYSIDCTTPTIFNRVESMKMNIKCQFFTTKVGNLKQFGFESILITFFLKQVPLFQYQLTEVDPPTPHDPRISHWGSVHVILTCILLMAMMTKYCHGGLAIE